MKVEVWLNKVKVGGVIVAEHCSFAAARRHSRGLEGLTDERKAEMVAKALADAGEGGETPTLAG